MGIDVGVCGCGYLGNVFRGGYRKECLPTLMKDFDYLDFDKLNTNLQWFISHLS